MGHIPPAGQLGESDVGTVKVSVWLIPPWHVGFVVQAIAIDEAIGTSRAATLPPKRMVLLLVKPKPPSVTVVPVWPLEGLTE